MATNKATQNYADFMKVFSDFKMPAFDMNDFFAIQRRNMEAFSTANQIIAESAQALSRRQTEILQAQLEELLNSSRDILSSNSPETSASKQADFGKKLFETQLSSLRELAEMASKSNVEAMDVLNKRAVKSMEDLNGLIKKAA